MTRFAPSKIWDFAACLELFKEAVSNRRYALLRGAIGGVSHEHQVRFVGLDDGDAGAVRASLVVGDRRTLDEQHRLKGGVEVSFSVEDAMLFFDSVIERCDRERLFGRRVLLRAPDKMSVVQQRKDGRVWVPEDCDLISRLAKIDPRFPTPRPENVIPGRVWDLSLSGASMICPVGPAQVGLRQEEQLEFLLQFGDIEVARIASVCYARPLSSRSVRLGLQFTDAQSPALQPGQNEKGISPMERLLNELEAAAARRKIRPAKTRKAG
jgi:PilZ domain